MPNMHAIAPATPDIERHFYGIMETLGPFERRPAVALALSGGVDSMALALLAHDWVQQQGGRLVALTVDHGLRDASAAEAKEVARLCRQHGIEHHTLRWQPEKRQGSVQSRAREARYRLLGDWCRTHHILHLLTAHHQDDQAETLFFRLARGSGLDGLAAIPALSYGPDVRLLRPLLGLTKEMLRAYLEQHSQSWVNDPTNQTDAYTRNVIRQHLEGTGQKERISQQAAALAERLGKIRNHMENNTASYLAKSVILYPEGYGLLDHRTFSAMPEEYGLRTLACLLQTLGGEHYRLRSEKLERLYAGMKAMPKKRTAGGLQLTYRPKAQQWLIAREPNAAERPLPVAAGQYVLWDGRFACAHHATRTLTIAPLGPEGAQRLRASGHAHPLFGEKSLLPFLPAFRHLEELVAVPHMQYRHPDYAKQAFFARFTPAKSLAASAFSGMNSSS